MLIKVIPILLALFEYSIETADVSLDDADLLNKALLGVSERFPILPSFFAPTIQDIEWIFDFTPEEVSEPSFLITTLLACDSGIKLDTCSKLSKEFSDTILRVKSNDFACKILNTDSALSRPIFKMLMSHGHHKAAFQFLIKPSRSFFIDLIPNEDIGKFLNRINPQVHLHCFLEKLFQADSKLITLFFTRLLEKYPVHMHVLSIAGLCKSKYVLKAILKSFTSKRYKGTQINNRSIRKVEFFCLDHEVRLKGLKMHFEPDCLQYFSAYNEYLHGNGSLDTLSIEEAVELTLIKKDFNNFARLVDKIPDIVEFFLYQKFADFDLDVFRMFEGKSLNEIPFRVCEALQALLSAHLYTSKSDKNSIKLYESIKKFIGNEELTYETQYFQYMQLGPQELIVKLQEIETAKIGSVMVMNLFNAILLLKTEPKELVLWVEALLTAFPNLADVIDWSLFLGKVPMASLKELLRIIPADYIFENIPTVPMNWTWKDLLEIITNNETWNLFKSKASLLGTALFQSNGPEIFKKTLAHLRTSGELKRFRRICTLIDFKDMFAEEINEKDPVIRREYLKFYGRFMDLNKVFNQ